MPHGGARRRGGSRYIHHVRGQQQGCRMQEFVFTTEQAYNIEFSPYVLRFFRNRGIIYSSQLNISGIFASGGGGRATIVGHTFVAGDSLIFSGIVGMVELNNVEIYITSVGSNYVNFSNDVSTFAAYVSGGVASHIYEVATNYSVDDIAQLTFAQSADTLFIFSPQWPTAQLTRQGHADWTLETANIEEGPFLDFNTDTTNRVSLDAAAGVAVMTFSNDTLEVAHEGALWRVWEEANGSSFGYAQWAPGSTATVSDTSFWEYNGNVYQVVSGGGGALGSTAAYPRHTEGTADVFYGGGIARMRYEHSGYCVVQVDTVLTTKNALVTILGKYRTPYTAYGGRSSAVWQEGAWSDKRGYPRTGAIHEQRLVAYSTEYEPSKRWGSRNGSYLNFRDGDKDDDGYSYVSASNQVAAIKFAVSTKRMVELSTSAELVMSASRSDEAITPTNVKISPETNYGCTDVRPVLAGPATLFVQRKGKTSNYGRRVREFVYNFQTDSYVAPDLTILSEHITYPGLVSGAFQAAPDLVVWYARSDGDLVGMTYERDQQVVGWHHQEFGANGDGAQVTNVTTIPGDDGDEVWMIVNREINGQLVPVIEWMQEGLRDGDGVAEGVFLDCSLSRTGSEVTTVSGLNHLEGETVTAFVDSRAFHGLVVSHGRVTLPEDAPAGSQWLVGYNYTSTIRTLRPEAGAHAGTSQGQIGRVDQVIVRLDRTVGGKIGSADEHGDYLENIQYREGVEPLSEPLPLFSGDKKVPIEGHWDRTRYVVIVQDEPFPMHVLSVVLGLSVSA